MVLIGRFTSSQRSKMLQKCWISKALQLLEPIKEKYPELSYVYLFQMTFAVAIQVAGCQNTLVRISWYCQQILYYLKVKGPDPMLKRTLKIRMSFCWLFKIPWFQWKFQEIFHIICRWTGCRLHLSICWVAEDAHNQLRYFGIYLML